MNRHKQKQNQNEKKLQSTQKHAPFMVETDAETLNKLLAREPYTSKDFIKCAKALFSKYGYDCDEQFGVYDDAEDIFDRFKKWTGQKPLFIAYEHQEDWIIICIVKDSDSSIKLLYKNPSGDVDDDMRQQFQFKVNFLANTIKSAKPNSTTSGPISLRNLRLFLEGITNNTNNFITYFTRQKFCTDKDLNNDQVNELLQDTSKIANNKQFVAQLRKFISNLPFELGEDVTEYQKVLAEGDMDKIKNAQKRCIDTVKLKEYVEKCEFVGVGDDFGMKIESEFPEEMKNLKKVLRFLSRIEVGEELDDLLRNICNLLNMNEETDFIKFKKLFEYNIMNEGNDHEEKKIEPTSVKNIKIPEMTHSPNFADNTSLEQLLNEVNLSEDRSQEIANLKADHQLAKDRYNLYKDYDAQMIRDWAIGKRNNLSDVCDCIAIMDRAFNLLTGGFRLRDTQILAVLMFSSSKPGQGRLCQIKTGEGKTNIVSFLATIKVLQGQKVDVITSNQVLTVEAINETKSFYDLFGITVSTNNTGFDFSAYTADVLYGTISSFQFDYLRDTFEGFNIRRRRKFELVILDEVDSMLIDNGGHVAKLSKPFPGMESLRYIYIRIWQALHRAEKSYLDEVVEKIDEKLPDPNSLSDSLNDFHSFLQGELHSERKIIKQKIRDAQPTKIDLIPNHLLDYVDSKLEVWIKNAVYAKYDCHEHQQYRIATDVSGENCVLPIDYQNTGVTMRNTIWSDGLHQFIQLKHNLRVTFENMTSSFISNIGYIRKYKDENIFGMTGTLGSNAEQKLLSSIYSLSYAAIPTYKTKMFQELDGIVVDDDDWHSKITCVIVDKLSEGRAVLVICETEQDLLMVKTNLEILQMKQIVKIRIRLYANEGDAKVSKQKVEPGDVIVATNIAGRGTNFRTTKTLEKKGGLHVCVGFLPYNKRVEDQAYGRTSRQGNTGTAQMVIRKSEIDEFGIDNLDFDEIKQKRDHLESLRLKEIDEVMVKELQFKDELFHHFAKFYRALKKEKGYDVEYSHALQDLNEHWAFWLDKKNFKAANLKNTVKQEFDSFKSEVSNIIKGKIQYNPYYSVSRAAYFLENGMREKAADDLNYALTLGNKKLMFGAHMMFFQIAIERGDQINQRLRQAIAKVFIFATIQKDEKYKENALKHLKDAKEALENEIHYNEKYLNINETNENQDLQDILVCETDGTNLFMKHIYSRLICLQVHRENVEYLIHFFETAQGGIDIEGKCSGALRDLDETNPLKKMITTDEIDELKLVGLDTLYTLKEIHDASPVVIHAAQAQIYAGLGVFITALIFLPAFPFLSGVAVTLITEGLIDIVIELISNGEHDFDLASYIKHKCISYGVAVVTMGISAVLQCSRIVTKVVDVCRKMVFTLRNSTFLTGVCKFLAKGFEKVANILEKHLDIIKFKQLTRVEQLNELARLESTGVDVTKFTYLGGAKKLESLQKLQAAGKLEGITRTDLALQFGKSIAPKITRKLAFKVVWFKYAEALNAHSKSQVKTEVANMLRKDEVIKEKLKTSELAEIDRVVYDFMQISEIQDALKVIASLHLDGCKYYLTDLINSSVKAANQKLLLLQLQVKFQKYLKEKLKTGLSENVVELVIERISIRYSDYIFYANRNLLVNFFETTTKVMGKMKPDYATETVSSMCEKINGESAATTDDENHNADDGTDENNTATTKNESGIKTENGKDNSTVMTKYSSITDKKAKETYVRKVIEFYSLNGKNASDADFQKFIE